MKRNIETTDYCCPLCYGQLSVVAGDQINPTNGITLYCSNKCPAQEVSGHGRNEKDAYAVIMAKFGGAKTETE